MKKMRVVKKEEEQDDLDFPWGREGMRISNEDSKKILPNGLMEIHVVFNARPVFKKVFKKTTQKISDEASTLSESSCSRPLNGKEETQPGVVPDDFHCKRSDGKQWRCCARAMPERTYYQKHYLQLSKSQGGITKTHKKQKGRKRSMSNLHNQKKGVNIYRNPAQQQEVEKKQRNFVKRKVKDEEVDIRNYNSEDSQIEGKEDCNYNSIMKNKKQKVEVVHQVSKLFDKHKAAVDVPRELDTNLAKLKTNEAKRRDVRKSQNKDNYYSSLKIYKRGNHFGHLCHDMARRGDRGFIKYWAEKGLPGFTVFKYSLRRLAGQSVLTTDQVHFSRGQIPLSTSDLRGLVCKDISNGQERIPVVASNVVDNLPVQPTGFIYLKSIKIAEGIDLPPPAKDCDCRGECFDPRKCSCARLNAMEFPYVQRDGGRLVEVKDDINSAHSLSVEAAYIKQNFSQQVLVRDGNKVEFEEPNPFALEWDGKIGDGDCGTTMGKGASVILEEMKNFYPLNDATETVNEIGVTLRRVMGGTSGVLYYIFCKAAYAKLKENTSSSIPATQWAAALDAAVAAVSKYGGVVAGYRTMPSLVVPYSDLKTKKIGLLGGASVGKNLIGLITSRDEIPDLLKLDDVIDLVIPRGKNKLFSQIKDSTNIPVLSHADGVSLVDLVGILTEIGQRMDWLLGTVVK